MNRNTSHFFSKSELGSTPSPILSPTLPSKKNCKKSQGYVISKSKALNPPRKSNRKRTLAAKVNHSSFDPKRNNDHCEACRGSGTFLCCDSCPRSFHLTCLNPPMNPDSIPEDEWHCFSCSPIPTPEGFSKNGVFGNLLEVIHKSNPVSFELPAEIKDCIKGVGTNEFGEYVNTEDLLNPKNRLLPIKSGWCRILGLKDKENNIVLCYFCHSSGLAGPMVGCDYCSLSWHLDCINPPLSVPPPPHLKWRCPIHAENLLPKSRKCLITLSRQNSSQVEVQTAVPPRLDPSLDEEQILSNFKTKLNNKRRLSRFPAYIKSIEQELFTKLLDPQVYIKARLNILHSFSGIFVSRDKFQFPVQALLPHFDSLTPKEKLEESIRIILGEKSHFSHTGTSLLKSDCPETMEIPRSLFCHLQLVSDLMKKVDSKDLRSFFNSHIHEQNHKPQHT